MSKPSESGAARVVVVMLLGAFAAVLWASNAAGEVVVAPEPAARAASAPPPAPQAKSRGTYRLRCWQYGRLLFEEYMSAMPSDGASKFSGRLAGTDRAGRPLHVTELQTTTCLAESARDDAYAARASK